ncbi:NAD(P)-dependent dehydrogenase, short-chain alcohol dehydrogenase family [Blastococcus sp. DSM 46786]|uniref:SDR family NAD(P)-dependent oxidoreductase n=1 Tax=Blastococcus sp. DSM 46786 TaxID=1798227 RepID=UPI0008C1891C|nr:SDR family oxidoreductase [Blastococcus sp. DSM 46786]SEK73513.1 NAD(P)-dependent dehydrogenase, short-chain alcohol dehydrogenase family [Blastococcus sp. DSM 46786]
MGILDGKVAMITGAGQGVGQGIALALAAEGCHVAVLGRTSSKLETTADLLRARGVKAEAIQCDVTETAAIPDAVAQVVDVFGGLDIQVNNAYFGAYGPLLSMDDRKFQRGFVSGPFAAFAFMKAAHPHLKERRGSIINVVSSVTVRWDLSTFGAYASAKWALRSLTQAAADEWGPDGIRVNAIAPHALSPGLASWVEANPEEAAEFQKTIPLGYIGDCEDDIGRAVAAIVSPAMRYLTGATVPLDGGQANFD